MTSSLIKSLLIDEIDKNIEPIYYNDKGIKVLSDTANKVWESISDNTKEFYYREWIKYRRSMAIRMNHKKLPNRNLPKKNYLSQLRRIYLTGVKL